MNTETLTMPQTLEEAREKALTEELKLTRAVIKGMTLAQAIDLEVVLYFRLLPPLRKLLVSFPDVTMGKALSVMLDCGKSLLPDGGRMEDIRTWYGEMDAEANWQGAAEILTLAPETDDRIW